MVAFQGVTALLFEPTILRREVITRRFQTAMATNEKMLLFYMAVIARQG
jgi:hypothetical protein